VLMDEYRQELLDCDDSEALEGVEDDTIDELRHAWEWFRRRTMNPNCICGLVFRLVEMGAVKDVGVKILLSRLDIGSLVENLVENSEEEEE